MDEGYATRMQAGSGLLSGIKSGAGHCSVTSQHSYHVCLSGIALCIYI